MRRRSRAWPARSRTTFFAASAPACGESTSDGSFWPVNCNADCGEINMQWTPGGTSSDIEDRRSSSGGGGFGGFGGMHLGIGGTLLLLVLSFLFRQNLFDTS